MLGECAAFLSVAHLFLTPQTASEKVFFHGLQNWSIQPLNQWKSTLNVSDQKISCQRMSAYTFLIRKVHLNPVED